MHLGLLCVLSVLSCTTAQNVVPAGFIPLPPLPVQSVVVPPASTAKVTPKPTLAPVTKKPTTTKAPFKPSTPTPSTPQPSTPQPSTPTPSTVTPSLPPSSHLPPSIGAPLATKKPSCGLNINVPSANCKGGNSAVQQVLTSLKQELSKTRQQHQAQDAAVQATISKLQAQQSGYLNKISDLQNEVQNLVRAFNSLSGARPISTAAPVTSAPGGTGVSNTFIQQAVQNVRNDMNTAVTDFNNKVFNLSSQILNNQQQDSKDHQSIESQIVKQSRDVARLQQQVADLNKLLQQLNSTGTGATSADVASLQSQIQKVASDVQKYDTAQRSQFGNLNLRTSSLQAAVNNHTSQMRGLQTNLLVSQNRINKVDTDITVVHDALAQFRIATVPRMNQIENDVKGLTSDVSSAQASVKTVGGTVFKLIQQIGQDTANLKSLETQTNQLQKDVSKMQSDLNAQNGEINTINRGMTSLKNAIPVSELNTMNNDILQILNSMNQGKAPSKQQLQDLTKSITTLRNKVGSLGTGGTPSG